MWSAAMTACGRQWMLGVVKGGTGMEEGASDAEKARAKSCSAFILQSVGARDDNFYYQATFTIVSQVAGKELTSVHDKEELKRGNTRLTRYKRAYLEKESNGELWFGVECAGLGSGKTSTHALAPSNANPRPDSQRQADISRHNHRLGPFREHRPDRPELPAAGLLGGRLRGIAFLG